MAVTLDEMSVAIAVISWVVGTLVVWALIAPPVLQREVRKTILKMFKSPDEETKAAVEDFTALVLPAFWDWFLTADTGNKIEIMQTVEEKDEETGKIVKRQRKVEVSATPYQALMRETGDYMVNMIRAYRGGAASQLARDMQAPDSPMGQMLGMVSPMALKRAAKDGDYAGVLMEMMLPKLMPLIEGRLKNVQNGTSSTTL